jgi:phosphoserine phosphatase
VLELIHLEKKKGVSAILVSASHESLVKKIAHHLGLFEEAVGTKNSNLKGRNKTK